MAVPLEISPQELHSLLTSAEPPRLIDCREQDESDICHLASAQLIPLSQFQTLALEKLGSSSPDQHIVIYCHHGIRSMRATQWLRAQGYSAVQSLQGGIDLWSQLCDPGLARY
jgi:rhodanese-related sulfurtransferase